MALVPSLSLMVRLCTLAMVVATKSQTESLRSGTIQTKVRVSSIFLFYGDARFEFEGVLIPELVVPENNNDEIGRAHV